jgi:hypothetical protein
MPPGHGGCPAAVPLLFNVSLILSQPTPWLTPYHEPSSFHNKLIFKA